MYTLRITDSWLSTFEKLTKKNPSLKQKIKSRLQKLADNPRYPVLHTHKVDTLDYGKRWSSSLTGNLRVIWDYGEGKDVIVLLDIGGHSGKRKVYK